MSAPTDAQPPRSAGSGRPDDPVLVVGAGPVGMACALLLARHGVPSTVLEASGTRTAVGSRSICTQRDVLDILDRVGCGEAAAAEGVTWTLGRTYYRQTQVATITFPETTAGYPPFINIPQTSVERLLAERLRAEPLVTLHRGVALTGLDQDADGVTVAAGPARWRAQWLVGCDGAHSAVRRLLGQPFPGESFDDQFLICDIRADLDFPAERRFYFDPPWNPGRQVLVHPQPEGVWRIDWQVPADFDLAAERASGALDERIRAITGATPYTVVWSSQYRFHQRMAPAFRVGRCLLAGDAAHLMAPFGARGLNSGFADAENAAWKLAHVVHGWAPEALLDSYHDERHAAAAENLRVTGATMRFLVPRTDADLAHRLRVLRAALTDPAAQAEIDAGRLSVPHHYQDSPLTTPAPGAAPQPGQVAPDGPCLVAGEPAVARLRQAFGPQWTVLAFGGPVPALPPPTGPGVLVRRVVRRVEAAAPGDVVDVDGVLHQAYRAPAAGPSEMCRQQDEPVMAPQYSAISAGSSTADRVRSNSDCDDLHPLRPAPQPGKDRDDPPAVWLVRPDGHLAGACRTGHPGGGAALVAILRRAMAAPTG